MTPTDPTVAGDAFEGAILCPICQREGCEDHLPVDPRPAGDDDHARRVESALAFERAKREARRRLDAEERGPVLLPTFDTLRDRLGREVPTTRWRIHGWQPCGARVMLASQFKGGKTTVVGNLIRCLVDGDAWLGRDQVEPITGTLALLDLEMGEAQLDAWLRVQQIRADDRVLVLPMRGRAASLNLLLDEMRAEWAARLRDAGATYLVLDCLRPVLDALALDEHTDAGRFLVALDRLLVDANIPEACVVQHMGHTGERTRGDSRLRDWPDVEWRVVRRDDDPASARFITAYGRDVDLPESQLTYDAETRRLTITGGSRKDAKLSEALDDVVAVLARDEPLSGRQIKEALEDSEHARDTIDAALRWGTRRGALSWQEGPKRARLYVRVSECPAVSG